ncbi:13354_t:CDS:2 [Acaulospora morrowiae]|uniref:13354_t:CDS:1 n=1 Tax=Acaulospora morrowiae TaxID=94023 RepID=A0A9N9CNB7_9GLOM|nr:13354_t:CDS:2 [Acaulospora morrowiae]
MYRPVGLLVCDFDETITQCDSTCEIAKLAYEKRSRQGKCPRSDKNKSIDVCPRPWSHYVKSYFRERKEHIKRWHETNSNKSLQDHYEFLKTLGEVEMISMERVEGDNCLSGICSSELFEHGRMLKKRDGAAEVLKRYLPKHRGGNDSRHLYILSTNWSRDMLFGSLKDYVGIEKERIVSNDLIFDEADTATGKLERNVLSAIDKLKIFKSLEIPKGTMSVYIGDSDTDLPCMLEADIGIIMGSNCALTETCEKFGIEVVDGLVGKINMKDFSSKKGCNKLFRVQEWKEILDSKLLGD